MLLSSFQKAGLCLLTLALSVPGFGQSTSSSAGCGVSSSKAASYATSSASSSASALTCQVLVSSRWGSGYQVDVKVNNPGTTAVNNWSVIVDVPAGDRFVSAWNAVALSQTTTSYTFGNVSWNSQIAPKGSVNVGVSLNGTGIPTCRVAGQVVNQAPIADFTTKVVNDTVHFESTATDPDGDKLTTKFDFGDGKLLQYKDVWHTYKTPGSYTVTQTVSDGKLTTTVIHTVVVGAAGTNHAPNAMFSYYTSGLNVPVNARASADIDGNALTYSWDFGSGMTTATTTSTASGTTESGGGYVTLTVFDGKLGNTQQLWVSASTCRTSDVAPNLKIVSNIDNVKLSLDASESSNADSFTWDFGDGLTATGMFANHTYAVAGTYTVTLKATAQMVSATKTATVVVSGGTTNLPPVVALKCQGGTKYVDDFVNYVSTITFEAWCDATASTDPEGASLSYALSWGDGSATESSSSGNFYHSYKIRGVTVPITLSVSDGINTTTKTIDFKTSEQVIPGPVAVLNCVEQVLVADNFSAGTADYYYSTSCDASGSSDPGGRPLNYQLSWGDNVVETSTTGKFFHNYGVAGDYNLTLIVNNGASGVYETKLWTAHAYSTVNKSPVACFDIKETANGIALSAACSTDPNGDALTYAWDFGDAYRDTGLSVEHSYFMQNTYFISLTVFDGKTYTTTTKMYEYPSPKKTSHCEFKITNEWNGGFTGWLRVHNDSTAPISNWSALVTFAGASTVSSSWNGTVTGTNPYTVKGVAWNNTIAPAAFSEVGFMVWGNGSPNTVPSLAGTSCK